MARGVVPSVFEIVSGELPLMSATSHRLIVLATACCLAGCEHLALNQRASSFDREVRPVMTEHSLALACLGDIVDQSGAEPITVYITDIEDETVPRLFRQRRLSHGGEWYLHTAISKMRSERVVSTINRLSRKDYPDEPHLVLSGAWTQDDLGVGVGEQGVEVDKRGSGNFDAFDWRRRRQVSVIAGDFVSAVDGRVVHASAISVAVGSRQDGMNLRIDDGDWRLDFALTNEANDGPQFAQRRIAEAAALVHVARAFGVDYRPCIERASVSPGMWGAELRQFMSHGQGERNRLMQEALVNAGFDPGAVDGIWGARSARAMMIFQTQQGLPPTGAPSAELYGLLLQHSRSIRAGG
jgi:hypothetical protein